MNPLAQVNTALNVNLGWKIISYEMGLPGYTSILRLLILLCHLKERSLTANRLTTVWLVIFED